LRRSVQYKNEGSPEGIPSNLRVCLPHGIAAEMPAIESDIAQARNQAEGAAAFVGAVLISRYKCPMKVATW
jgi:hypothetical protein